MFKTLPKDKLYTNKPGLYRCSLKEAQENRTC